MKRNTLNVRTYLEWVIQTADMNDKYPGAPIVLEELPRMRFFAKATLRKHAAKGTRKDIYVEA